MVKVETAESRVFLGLWLDEDLLREEFEAIVAADHIPDAVRAAGPVIVAAVGARKAAGDLCGAGRRRGRSRPGAFTA